MKEKKRKKKKVPRRMRYRGEGYNIVNKLNQPILIKERQHLSEEPKKKKKKKKKELSAVFHVLNRAVYGWKRVDKRLR